MNDLPKRVYKHIGIIETNYPPTVGEPLSIESNGQLLLDTSSGRFYQGVDNTWKPFEVGSSTTSSVSVRNKTLNISSEDGLKRLNYIQIKENDVMYSDFSMSDKIIKIVTEDGAVTWAAAYPLEENELFEDEDPASLVPVSKFGTAIVDSEIIAAQILTASVVLNNQQMADLFKIQAPVLFINIAGVTNLLTGSFVDLDNTSTLRITV